MIRTIPPFGRLVRSLAPRLRKTRGRIPGGVYWHGGIRSDQFGLGPSNSEIRVLRDCYRSAVQECGRDPIGLARTHTVPGTV